MPTILITDHVIERYLERIDDSLSYPGVRALLEDEVRRAMLLKERTRYGQLRYRASNCILVVKETTDGGLLAVTVYPLPVQRGQIPPREWAMALDSVRRRAEAACAASGADVANVARLTELPIPAPRAFPPTHVPATPAQVRQRAWPDDQWLEHRLAEIDRALTDIVVARAHMATMTESIMASVPRQIEKYVAHGQRMQVWRDDLHARMIALAPFLPDTPEVREILGPMAKLVFRTSEEFPHENR